MAQPNRKTVFRVDTWGVTAPDADTPHVTITMTFRNAVDYDAAIDLAQAQGWGIDEDATNAENGTLVATVSGQPYMAVLERVRDIGVECVPSRSLFAPGAKP